MKPGAGIVLVIAVAAGLTATTPAATATAVEVELAVASLRRDPVYVHPHARGKLDDVDAARLRERLSGSPLPMFVAVLPTGSQSAEQIARDIETQLNRRGIVIVHSRGVGAHATGGLELEPREVAAVTASVRSSHGTGSTPFFALADLVDRLQRAADAARTSGRINPNIDLIPRTPRRSAPLLVALPLAVAVAWFLWTFRGRGGQHRPEARGGQG